jgi:hemophore-related protein
MKMSTFRRSLCAALVGGALSVSLISVPVATAAPSCSDPPSVAQVKTASEAVNAYLNAHPDVKQQLIQFATENHDQSIADIRRYYDTHPQVRNDLRALRDRVNSIAGPCANEAIPAYLQRAFDAL